MSHYCDNWETYPCTLPDGHEGPHQKISTRRRWPRGAVHEMADLGVGTLCGKDMPEPWEWTDDPITCKPCLRRIKEGE